MSIGLGSVVLVILVSAPISFLCAHQSRAPLRRLFHHHLIHHQSMNPSRVTSALRHSAVEVPCPLADAGFLFLFIANVYHHQNHRKRHEAQRRGGALPPTGGRAPGVGFFFFLCTTFGRGGTVVVSTVMRVMRCKVAARHTLHEVVVKIWSGLIRSSKVEVSTHAMRCKVAARHALQGHYSEAIY
jgi:hypothetical protein